LAVDGELDFEGGAGGAEADQELFGGAFESVVDVGYTVGVDAGDDGRVWIYVTKVYGLDEGGVGFDYSLVHGAIEGDGDLEVDIGVGAVAGGIEAGDYVVSGNNLLFEDGVGAIDAVEEVVGGGLAISRLDHVDVIGVNLLGRRGDIASVGCAEVADNTGMGAEIVAETGVGLGVFGFIGAEPVDGIDGILAPPTVFELGEEGVVAGIAEVVEQRVFVVEGGDAGERGALVRGTVGDDELDSDCFGGMLQQHFFDEDAAERMGEENDFAMLPDVVLLEAVEEDFSQLVAGHFAVFVRGGVLGNFDVGEGEARVGADHIGPIGTV